MAAPALLLLLLGCFSCGRAQLTFNSTDPATKSVCDRSVVLPCFVNNLLHRDATQMVVEWRFKNELIYVYDPTTDPEIRKYPGFDSADLDLAALPTGDASLRVGSASQATPGTYACEVTESNRAGKTAVELKEGPPRLFSPTEKALLGLFLLSAVLCFWIHFALLRADLEKPVCYILAGLVPTVCAAVGLALLFSAPGCSAALAGLGIAVLGPLLTLPPLQCLLRPKSVRIDGKTIGLTVVKIIGIVIGVVGLAMCVAVYPPTMGWLLILGISIFTLGVIAHVVYAAQQRQQRLRRSSASPPLKNTDADD